MKANQLLLVVFLLSTLIGCRTKQVPVFIERVVKDSIVIRDTIQQVKLEPYFEEKETSDTLSYLSNKYAYSEARVSNNKLYHSLGIWDKFIGVTTLKITEYKIIKEPVPYEVEKIVKVEKELSLWQKTRMRAGEIAMLFVAFFLLRKLKTPKLL